jgi:hypothetical protein
MTIARGIQQGIFDWLGRDVGRRPAKKIFLGGFLENTKNVFWDFSDKDFEIFRKVFRDFGKIHTRILGFLEKCLEILENTNKDFWNFRDYPEKNFFWAACGRPSLSNHKITCMILDCQSYRIFYWIG